MVILLTVIVTYIPLYYHLVSYMTETGNVSNDVFVCQYVYICMLLLLEELSLNLS